MAFIDPQLREAIRSRRTSFWITAVAFVAMIVVGLAFVWSMRELAFDSERWKNDEHLRPRMVRDLLDRHDLIGLSRGDVDALLGVPQGRDSVRDGRYIYWAGTDGVIDDLWLEIDFDNETVTTTRHYPD